VRTSRPKVILIGAGPTSLSALESLLADCDVQALFRSESAGDPVTALADASVVPVLSDMTPAAVQRAIEEIKPECVVISSYNRIVGPRLIELCPFINVHYSPLPRYRGRANVNWALINGEREAAISIHTVVPGLDAGNILFQRQIPIDDDRTITGLYTQLNDIQREHLGATVRAFLGGFAGAAQEESAATYGCTRIPADGEVDWTTSTKVIYNLIRALQDPYPNAYTFLHCRPLQIVWAEPVKNAPLYAGRIPGRVVAVDKTAGTVDVLTGDGVLRIVQVQFENGELLQPSAIIRSTKVSLGLRTRELLSLIQQLETRVNELAVKSDFIPKQDKEGNSCYPEPIAS
jgi:methionyl-tRNA formyltransferase